ncbi:bis(5'-nucleosyl)-tetraphosphatase [Planctomicrobium sp. SH661]|uniref:bis(5'-nucleosyl)-tetraphosphatase n=1 Tax=Planctomicrobium sp. SH661 TaxID=3448124 RepID=UPI003F5C47FC
MSRQEPKSCGVLIASGDPIQSFLLMKHADRWDLPKGHVDPGETEIECALREMHEETGIDPALVTIDPAFRYVQQYEVQSSRYGGDRKQTVLKTLIIFLARIDHPCEIVHTEHLGSQWFSWTSPPPAIQARTIDPLLQQLDQFLRVEG